MYPQLIEFLKNHRIAALSLILANGNSHTAVLHYSFQETPLRIFFQTSTDSRKIRGSKLMDNESSVASLAIGFSEQEWLTFQAEGDMRVVTPDDKKKIQEIHYAKFPNAGEYANDPDTVILEFVPSWWRFSDYNTDPPKTISSDN